MAASVHVGKFQPALPSDLLYGFLTRLASLHNHIG